LVESRPDPAKPEHHCRHLAGGWDIGEIVEAMSDAERFTFRKGIEAVNKLREALDQTDVEEPPEKLN
jgi:hypothetical protein